MTTTQKFPLQDILRGLQAKGHALYDRGGAGSEMTAIKAESEHHLVGVADYRRSGGVDGL